MEEKPAFLLSQRSRFIEYIPIAFLLLIVLAFISGF
jgi:uncharacterized membrane protein YecN with MAPEG domain